MTAVLERLGRTADSRLLIVTCDGLGSSNSANRAVYEALRHGLGTTTAIMMPCPWARGAAAEYGGEDVGVSLTLNSEHEHYRWGPLTHAPSLLDGDGGMPRTVTDVWDHADTEEVLRECRAQVERAVLWGFDVSHLDAHLGALYGRPEFFDTYLELAYEFRLPISLPDPSVDLGFPARQLALDEGIMVPDHVVSVPIGSEARQRLQTAIEQLQPGVTELHLRPAEDTPELRAITPTWAANTGDAHLVTYDAAFRKLVESCGAEVIGYRTLRDIQRAASQG